MEIKAKNTETDVEITVEKNLGSNLQELVGLYGEETVYNNAVDSMVITTQSLVRRASKANKTQVEIQAMVDAQTYTGGSRQKKDPVEAFLGKFDTWSPEKQEEMLAALRAKIAALQG